MAWRGCLRAVLPSLLAASCSGRSGAPAADAGAGPADAPGGAAEAGADVALGAETPAAAAGLTAVLIHEAGNNPLDHLECMMNAAGDGIAVWRQSDAEFKSQAFASYFPRDQRGWQPARRISGSLPTLLDAPGAALDDQGRAVAVWNESDGNSASVFAARFDPVAGWTPAERVAAGWMLKVASGASGDAVAYGALQVAGTMPILLRSAAGGAWQADSAFRVDHPGAFFASAQGSGLLVWNQPAGASGDQELFTSDYTPGGVWSPPLRLQEGRPFDQPLPILDGALAGDGSGLLLWNRGGTVEGELWASARPPGGAWSAPRRLNETEAPLWTTAVVQREGGNGLVVWETGDRPRTKVWAAVQAGADWQPSLKLGDSSEIIAGAMAPSGSAVVGWSSASGVYARRYTPGAGWQEARIVRDSRSGVDDLCAAIDGSGQDRAWLMWIGGSPERARAVLIAP